MYPHQKKALNWMMKQENSQNLPPFWEMKGGQYFNTVLNYQRKDKPESVRGGEVYHLKQLYFYLK